MSLLTVPVVGEEELIEASSGPATLDLPTASRIAVMAMADVPKLWKARLRRLTLGPEEGAMVRWSYHDGSTWAAILFDGDKRRAKSIIGWAAFTLQEDRHPIIGTFVSPEHRGRGYGKALVAELIAACRSRVPGGCIYAVGDWWPCYPELIEAAGFRHYEWG